MTLSDESIEYGRNYVRQLLEAHGRLPIQSNISVTFYYKNSNNLIDEADYHYKNQQFEESFILYSRYITLFIKDIKLHPKYATVSASDHGRITEIIRSKAMPRAEELKAKLQEKYAREYETSQRAIQEEENAKISAAAVATPLPTNVHTDNAQVLQQLRSSYTQLPPGHVALFSVPATDFGLVQPKKEMLRPGFDRTQKPALSSTSTGMNSYRQVAVPNDITPKFLQIAQRNTERKIETCGILAGIQRDAQYIITHIVIPKQNGGPDYCDTEKEEEMVEYISTHNLITLGWIHTHPTQTVFCSSVDLHTHLPYQMLMQEAIAIVVSPKYNQTEIFSLTPDVGIPTLAACKKTGFHEHVNNPPLYVPSKHTSYDPGLQCQIVDLRN